MLADLDIKVSRPAAAPDARSAPGPRNRAITT
jgi:hypothetical protein